MDRYDIDDILEEARHLKERHKDMPASSGPVEPAPAGGRRFPWQTSRRL